MRDDTGFIAERAEFCENRCFPIEVRWRRFIRHEWIAHLELSSEQARKTRGKIRIDRVRSFATALNEEHLFRHACLNSDEASAIRGVLPRDISRDAQP
ncbi:MAG TPA: hypothetical protein VGN03_06150 [Steroidobacteraceae bacterium]